MFQGDIFPSSDWIRNSLSLKEKQFHLVAQKEELQIVYYKTLSQKLCVFKKFSTFNERLFATVPFGVANGKRSIKR